MKICKHCCHYAHLVAFLKIFNKFSLLEIRKTLAIGDLACVNELILNGKRQ